VRGYVRAWRDTDYPGITRTTRQLLEYWKRPERNRRLFFCQIEAVETAICLTECAERLGRPHLLNLLRDANEASNPGLNRVAFKLATGSGKTVVMAMLIAWHALNKIENPQDARFSDSFLIVAPGITIRDRLRVPLPNEQDRFAGWDWLVRIEPTQANGLTRVEAPTSCRSRASTQASSSRGKGVSRLAELADIPAALAIVVEYE
jgi:hypothetical protein